MGTGEGETCNVPSPSLETPKSREALRTRQAAEDSETLLLSMVHTWEPPDIAPAGIWSPPGLPALSTEM